MSALVCWVGEAEAGGGALARLEQATAEIARSAGCEGRPIFLPQDESSAWAWLPLGATDTFSIQAAGTRAAGADAGITVRPRRRWLLASRASAAPTSRRWARTRSRWPRARRRGS